MILFSLFWMWIIVLGFKGMLRRIGQLAKWLCTPSGNSDYQLPPLRGSVGQAWDADEYRHYSSLAAKAQPPSIPDVVQGMQQALDQEKRTAEQLGKDISDWQHAIEQLRLSVDDWTEKTALALSNGRQELARAAIAERHRAQQRISELERDVAEMRRLLTCHASDIQSLESQLSGIYRRNHMAETRLSAAESSTRTRQLLYGEEVKDALSRFEALERAADLAEGKADALALGAPASAPEDKAAIDAQLEALRPSAGFGRKRASS
jgi:phage shock protein A